MHHWSYQTTHNLQLFRYYYLYFVLKIKLKTYTYIYIYISCSINSLQRFWSLYILRGIKLTAQSVYTIWSARIATTPENSTENIPPARRTESAARQARFKGGEYIRKRATRMPKRCCWILDLGSSIFRWRCDASVGLVHTSRTHARTRHVYVYIIPSSRLSAKVYYTYLLRNWCTLRHRVSVVGLC